MQRKQNSLWLRGRLGLVGRVLLILLGFIVAFLGVRMATSPTVEATAPVQPVSVEDIAPVEGEGTDSIASSSSPFEWVWSEANTGPLAPAAPNNPTDGSGNADILYGQGCMGDVGEFASLNCTANDVSIVETLSVTVLDDGCAFPGDTVKFKAVFKMLLTAQARYDVGLYFVEDGSADAEFGTCSVATPPYAPDPPWLDLDGTTGGTQDTCGDINSDHSPLTSTLTLTATCVDRDGGGSLDLPYCSSWRQKGANELCTSPTDAFPGTKSKCNCDPYFEVDIMVPKGPELHIDKQCTPDVVEAGGKVTCTIAYSNTGDVQATSVWIEDNYNQTKGSVSDISDGGVDDGDVISWTIGTVAVSARETVSYVYTVNTGVSDGDIINNLATIYSDYEDPLQDVEEFDVVKPAISIVKDADPEYILSGDTVIYRYYVTNDSDDTPLTDVVVTDDKCTPVEEVDVDDLLNPAETWEYLCTKSVTETTTNTGEVTAQPADASGNSLPGIDRVSDDDTAKVNVVTPTIQVEKTAYPTKTHSGETVKYTYKVTNIGNVALDNVSVKDLDHPSCVKNWDTDELAVDETWTYNCSVSVSDDITNTAEAEGHGAPLDPGEGVTTDQDTATVDVIHPAIEVVKTAYPLTIQPKDWVTYTYRVENTGDDTLTNVKISDDKCDSPTIEDGDPDQNPDVFNVGDVLTYTCSMTLTSTTSNEATVTGTDSLGVPVVDTSSPPVQVKVVVPGFEIDKSASADAVHVGDTVTYTYEVSNTSSGDTSVVLTDVVVTDDDDRCSDLGDPAGDDNSNGLLDAGETWVYSCTATMEAGDKDETTNIFDASAVVSDTGDPVSDEDQYTVEVLDPSISVVKSVDRTIIQSGDTVTYTYEVENTGNVSVTVDISDDECGTPNRIVGTGTSLDPGKKCTYECTMDVTGDLTNTVTVTGTDRLGKDVNDTDQETVDVVAPVIEITKTANPTVTTGGAVEYIYEVENSGDVALHIDDVVDDQCASPDYESGDNSNGWLDVDKTWTYKCTKTGVTVDITNTVVVTATPVDDDGHTLLGFDQVTDTTKATVDVVDPAISVVKTADPTKTYVGKTVVYTYTVTNDGDTVLTDVQVDDWVEGSIVCSPDTPESKEDGDTDDLFEPGETWVYTCTQTVDDTTDNTVTVSGQPSDANGNSWDHIGRVSDSDTASVEVINPSFSVVKEPSAEKISPGGTVTYTYTVENTGDDPLDSFEIEDDKCDSVTGPAGDTGEVDVLSVDETWTYSCTAILNNDTTNTVVVTGTDSLGKEITRTTDAFVDVVIAGVDVEKMANEYTIHSGDTVTYTYEVSNTSEGVLTDVVVTDDHCDPVYKSGDDGDDELEQGELWIYECMTDTMDVTTENEVLATATVSDTGKAVSDTAHVEVVVIHPAITVTKSADKTVIRSGSSVKYTYEVSNPGDTPLSSVEASDPDCNPGSPISGDENDNNKLDTDEVWTYECSTVINEDTTNTVKVEGYDSLSRKVTARASEFVDVVTPTIEIVKTANPTTIPAGEETTVQYTYMVENTGEVTLSEVNVADKPVCPGMTGPTGDDGNDDLLSPGESWTYQCSMEVSEAITNTATANGKPWNEETSSAIGSCVSDTDKASVEIEEEEEVIPVGGITLPTLPFTLRSLALLLGLLLFGGVAIGGWRFGK